MAARPILILHGWSDHATSFAPLADALRSQLGAAVVELDLGDYLSLDDDVTYDDLTDTLYRAWQGAGLPMTPGAVDVIVHSTGGLVIRHFLSQSKWFSPDTVPIKHLVMLAPANFGSPLAHKGWSFIGRVFRGNSDDDHRGQVGKRLLKGLEMASPFSWGLAMRDRFGERAFYQQGRILCTVFVGNKGYSGLAAMVNENGSDGTVCVSTANMNAASLTADFATNPSRPTYSLALSKGKAAFGVVEGANHKTITLKEPPPDPKGHLENIVGALQVDDAGFDAWCAKLDAMTKIAMDRGAGDRYTHGYQNTVVHLADQYAEGIGDYTVEFQADTKDIDDKFAEDFHQHVIETVHAHSDDSAYRSLMIDCTMLYRLGQPQDALLVNIAAEPELDGRRNLVGYVRETQKEIGALRVDPKAMAALFVQNRTLLADLSIQRLQDSSIFTIKPR